jgi:hypothetical protein
MDSCVEFFFGPKADAGYFNVEVHCGGKLLMYYIQDPTRTESGLAKYTPVKAEHARRLTIYHSIQVNVDEADGADVRGVPPPDFRGVPDGASVRRGGGPCGPGALAELR